MAYTINKSDGTQLTVIQDGTVDTTTSLNLLGRNYSGYGIKVAENFVKLLENFSYSIAPATPLKGQLWYDTTAESIKVWDGLSWQRLANIVTASSQPTGNVLGDFWWDSGNGQLKVYDGSAFITVGPVTPSGFGVSGQVVEQVLDTINSPHVVVKEFIDSVLVAIYSKDATFTPQTPIVGFTQIKPGLNLSANISGSQFVGTALNADLLDNLNSTDFLRANVAAATSGSLTVLNDTGVTIGDGQDLQLRVTDGVNVQIRNQTTNGNISLVTGSTTAIQINGNTGLATVAANPVADLGIATKQFVEAAIAAGNVGVSSSVLFRDGSNTITGNLVPNANNTLRLGNVGAAFSNVHSTTFTGNLSATTITSSSGTFSGGMVVNSLISNTSISGSSLTVNGSANVRAITAQVNNAFDIGSSTSRFATVFASAINAATGTFSGAVTTGSVSGATVSGTTASFTGTVSGGALTVTGNSTVGNIIPSADVTFDLGSGGSRFRNIFANSFVSSAPVSVTSGGSGANSLTGILVGNGTSPFTAVTQPAGDIVGTTATQTLTNKTITGLNTASTINHGAGTVSIGYRNLPRNLQTGNYTLALSDEGKFVYSNNTVTPGQTIIIPTNDAVPFPIGTAVTIVNDGLTLTISPASGVILYQGGTTNTGSRSIALRGIVTLLKHDTNAWYITGAGIS